MEDEALLGVSGNARSHGSKSGSLRRRALPSILLFIAFLFLLPFAMQLRDDVPQRIYSVVPGFFVQGDERTDLSEFDIWSPDAYFGLVNKSWVDFRRRVDNLQRSAAPSEQYKVFFAQRHGEGWHNRKEAEVGTQMWDCHWSLLYGDGKMTWGPDPELTELGEAQARRAHDGWKVQIARGAPHVDAILSSPLTRAASTCNLTWSGLTDVRPLIRESYREMIGLHTCDQRRSRSFLVERFSHFDIEPGFAEKDPLWTPDLQEPQSSIDKRVHIALEELFENRPDATYISITAHGGVLTALKHITGHPDVSIPTGGMFAAVIKGVLGPRDVRSAQPSGTAPPCPPARVPEL